jgi:outer membrane murein-binding lipoprotein Lpp
MLPQSDAQLNALIADMQAENAKLRELAGDVEILAAAVLGLHAKLEAARTLLRQSGRL